MNVDPLSVCLGAVLGFGVRHYLPVAIGYLAVELKRTRRHGQEQ